MFCPNCASQNEVTQHYCRTCGLKLDIILEDLSAQRPSEEFARLLLRKRRFELAGIFCLSMAGFLGLCIVITAIFYNKMQWVGPQLLFGSASIALVLFTILSGFLLSYPKFMMKVDKLNYPAGSRSASEVGAITTHKLIEERPFEPVPSVTEDATELLPVHSKTKM